MGCCASELLSCEQSNYRMKQMVNMMFISKTPVEINMIMRKKNHVLYVDEIPRQWLTDFIKYDNDVDFMYIYDIVDDQNELLNTEIKDINGDPMRLIVLLFISHSNKILARISDDLIDYYIHDEYTETFDINLLHMACARHNYQIMNKIMENNINLIYETNEHGYTPFDFFLIAMLRIDKFYGDECFEFIDRISKNMYFILYNNRTIVYDDCYPVVPVGSNFVDIIKIIINKSNNDRLINHMKKVNDRIFDIMFN